MTVGIGLAVGSAVAFGVTTPLIDRLGGGASPLVTASLLYGGAALLSMIVRPWAPRSGRPVTARAAPRLMLIALFGATLAPVAMVWGLARVGALTASLLLNLEAVFTVLLGALAYREPLGRRMIGGVLAMIVGGVALTLDAGRRGGPQSLAGILALVGCTFAWATDNTLSRGLRDEDPADVVMWKGALGAVATGTFASIRHEAWPSFGAAAALLTCGAVGYGASLRLYLLAQRRIGASRTGSAFAIGPFVGALLGWALGDRQPGSLALLAGAAFGTGVYLHLTERHSHPHVHEPVTHEHAHRHDDGHHGHEHSPPVAGEHSHVHSHGRLEHDHDHALDVHHDHRHA